MEYNTPRVRLSQREPYCRCCGKDIPKDTPMVHSYIVKNGNGNLYLCFNCIDRMYDLVMKWEGLVNDI